jgi:XTP/dITP diphosphohydrolase
MRIITEKKILVATHNQGKLEEFRRLLSPFEVEVVSAAQIGLAEPEETGQTFSENAVLKATLSSKASGLVSLADDSGLCVNALSGRPGLYSARWAGEKRDFFVAMKRINDELGDAPDRSAYFFCALAVAWPDGHVEIIEERCDGKIVWPPRGANGHGYDPVFVPKGDDRAFAEMSFEEKNGVSHRGKALRALAKKMFDTRNS